MKLVLSNQGVHTTIAALEESYVGMRSRGDISKYPIFASAMIGSAAMHTITYVGIILYEGVILQ